jgi:hypothetical protein
MSLKILCSGYLLRYPLGGFSYHHLQYLVGFARLGHQVTYFEDWGWESSCYDPRTDEMTADPAYGVGYLSALLREHGLDDRWSYFAENGRCFGLPRDAIAQACRECDVYFNLSNINQIPELDLCRRRVMIDTDPVFTQIQRQGMDPDFARYSARFTYGENVHRRNCTMPTSDFTWMPTRQPIVLELWPVTPGDPASPITTVMNWSAYGDHESNGKMYGQKDRMLEPYLDMPRELGLQTRLALSAPDPVKQRLEAGGWGWTDATAVTRDTRSYQQFIRDSKAEFCVAKHGYVTTRCGWFSDRSSGYLASGRPVVVQDTGFADFLPCGRGLMTYQHPEEARAAIRSLDDDYPGHCRAARAIAAEYFDSRVVLSDLLARSL